MQQLENQVSLVFLGVFVWDFHMSWMRFGQFWRSEIAKLQFEHCIGDHFEIRKRVMQTLEIFIVSKDGVFFVLCPHMNMESAGFLGVAILSNII